MARAMSESAAELRRLHAVSAEMLGALQIAKQFMVIATDWNFDEVEIDGEMRFTNDLLKIVQNTIAKAEGEFDPLFLATDPADELRRLHAETKNESDSSET